MKKSYGNSRSSKSSDLRFKRYKDENELFNFRKRLPLQDHRTLEEKIELIDKNFEISDKKLKDYLSIKTKLTGGRLFRGEVIRYRKDLIKSQNKLFESFKRTWFDFSRYKQDLPSKKVIKYSEKYKTYNYNVRINSFN